MNEKFSRPLLYERLHLRSPMNEIIFTARIQGIISSEQLSIVLQKLRVKHPLLSCKIQFDEEGRAEFIEDNDIKFNIDVKTRDSDQTWVEHALTTSKHPFNVETGPLIRFALISDNKITDLILYCHHIICDGLSLSFLIKHIMEFLANPNKPIEPIKNLPLVINENFPHKTKSPLIIRLIFSWLNRKWRKVKKTFSETEFKRMFNEIWKNKTRKVYIHEFSREISSRFVNRCKKEEVTVNSAFFAAMASAENKILYQNLKNKFKIGLPIDLRDKLIIPIGESLGLYAGAFSLWIKFDPSKKFWEQCRFFHKNIKKNFSDHKIFAISMLNLLEPNLIDALYFQTAGKIDIPVVRTFTNIFGIIKPIIGVGITNLRTLELPEQYGDLKLDFLTFIPPCVMNYNLVMGLWSFSGKIGFSFSYWEPNISEDTIKEIANQLINLIENEC
ncbi:MAG: hypothetical protein EAX96_17550 [Candidatus Lokiarchaeota archaeon]|nr:hypothetical protein [Candidatus Lokiarchaeota archaeon]